MSLADDAKLLLIPTGYKASKVYSVFPTDGDGDFTYTRSGDASRVNPGGLIETISDNIPRIDHTGGGCPTLLLEPQRTNYATNNTSMNTYSNSVFGNNPNPTQTANYTIAPDGTLTATRLQTSKTGTNYSLISFPTTSDDGSGGGYYTASVYVKSNTGSSQSIAFYGANSAPNNRTATTEWSRIQFTGQRLGNTKYAYLGTINGTDDDIDISVWGAQIELVDSYPSSLIYTGASTVTRLKDECYGGGNANLFNTEIGVIYLELKKNGLDSTFSGLSLSDGTTSNRIEIRYVGNSNTIQVVVRVGGSAVVVIGHTISDVTQKHKLAFKFEADNYAFWVNGSKVGTDTSGALPPNLSEFAFDDGNGNFEFFGNVYDARVYTNDLTDSQLTELTTL